MVNKVQYWYVCDKEICVYRQESLWHLRSDPPRCIKHGAILAPRSILAGKTRGEIRKLFDEAMQ